MTEQELEKHQIERQNLAITFFNVYRERIVQEDNLINQRTTWFINFNAFLFTSLALSSRFPDPSIFFVFAFCCATVGVGISLTTLVGVRAAYDAIERINNDWGVQKSEHMLAEELKTLPALKGATSTARDGIGNSVEQRKTLDGRFTNSGLLLKVVYLILLALKEIALGFATTRRYNELTNSHSPAARGSSSSQILPYFGLVIWAIVMFSSGRRYLAEIAQVAA